ncbi:zinc-binding dehydrogenase [Haloferax sp. DFSO52]|uniref:zinc-binding dehydrogenase n=1 Tax=Haloferax sp. DFSO52 TaxID=3388505 RepID=UPI003A84BB6B
MKGKASVLWKATKADSFVDNSCLSMETVSITEPVGEEVVVEVKAASLCHTDVSIAHGHIDEQYPLVMGHEGAGIVRAVGDAVESVEPGDHVVLGRPACGRCTHCREANRHLCERRRESTPAGTLRTGEVRFDIDGDPVHHCHGVSSFAEYTLVTEEVAIPITDEVPFEKATLLGCGIFTGVGAVLQTAQVEFGSSVAIFGAGGVGLSAVQGARLANATDIVVVDLVAEKLDTARDLGATETVDASETDPVEYLQEEFGGVDYAFDVVGHPTVVEQAIAALRPTGTAVLVGTPPAGIHELGIELHDFILDEKQVLGSFNGSFDLQEAIPKLAALVAAGDLVVDDLISSVRPLDALPEAMDELENGDGIRHVLVP